VCVGFHPNLWTEDRVTVFFEIANLKSQFQEKTLFTLQNEVKIRK
jgi:hypothetical protein